eukprot:CAMPEP_0115544490 /NCGR_PEP_ID=MMETSP0271-20121206/92115_1 /TAXON_ID=71861 /ORGANISM="Scrippsiella trochoidea, Strain CCMP3099" /LENGTH=182 /DNA_ID=CAMNT_0002977807 /DNA_START=158 /DNA_END=703 /DNA_ORIENTATION=-
MAFDDIYSELRGRFANRIHIEDPFLLSRNLHCALRPELEEGLYSKLWDAAQAMQQGFLPVGLQPDMSRGSQDLQDLHTGPMKETMDARPMIDPRVHHGKPFYDLLAGKHSDVGSDLETECTSGLAVNPVFGSDWSGQTSEGGEYDGVGALLTAGHSKDSDRKDLCGNGHSGEVPKTRLTERW